jgi:hypothetical protein
MSNRKLSKTWIVLCLYPAVAAIADAQSRPRPGASAAGPDAIARFAEPVVLRAGDRAMGSRRMYPSPVFRDMNGDGRLDIVIGDLVGKITIANALEGDGAPQFARDEPMLGRDAKPLDFKNW